MATHPIKMRLTSEAITDLGAYGLVIGEPSPALAARRIILAALGFGSGATLPPLATRLPAPPSDQPPPMGQLVMRLDQPAIAALERIAAERGLDSPALAARALLADAMQAEGLTNQAYNAAERTRRETDALSHGQSEAIRLVTRIAILADQVEAIARSWRDATLLDRARQSRAKLSQASAALRHIAPAPDWTEAIKARGHAANGIARALHAGDPIERHRARLMQTLDHLDAHLEALA